MIKRKPRRLVGARKPKKAQKTKLPSISKLIKACDAAASEKVRGLSGRTDRTFGTCYTCGKKKMKRKMDCGHFISRKWKAVRWNFDNMRPQCKGCNKYAGGEPQKFRRHLIAEIGIERVENLEKIFDDDVKLSRQYLTDLLTSLTT